MLLSLCASVSSVVDQQYMKANKTILSRRSKINLAMSAIVLLLALGVYLTPGSDVSEKSVRLTGIEPADVVRIRIENREGGSLALEKRGGQWVMTSPGRMEVDGDRVTGLLRLAVTPSHLQLAAENRDLDSFGLATPIGSIHLNDTELAFGSTEPVHRRRYVLVDGRINLIDDGFYHHLMAKPEGFAAKPRAQNSASAGEEAFTTESQRTQR